NQSKPAADKRGSVAEVVTRYFLDDNVIHMLAHSTLTKRGRILQNYARDHGHKPIASVTTDDLAQMLAAMRKRGAAEDYSKRFARSCGGASRKGRSKPIRPLAYGCRAEKRTASPRGTNRRSRNSRRIIPSARSRGSRSRCCSTPHSAGATSSAWGASTFATACCTRSSKRPETSLRSQGAPTCERFATRRRAGI